MKQKIIVTVLLIALLSSCGNTVSKNDESTNSVGAEVSSSAEREVSAESIAESESTAEENPAEESSSAEDVVEIITEMNEEAEEEKGLLESAEDIQLTDVDGWETNYTFIYDGETYSAVYTPDNWKIIDSYKMTSEADMVIICGALAEVHPVHGCDGESFREPEDMAYEWVQHNIAYEILPDDNSWKAIAKDVDINPADQNKSLYEMYKSKTGGSLN
ncbi:MAG: hypothetical protein K6F71_09825 [Ruminococcus sp.]|uniref:hypothetical protein n=1 Tax=Ruminococcus sp. TaxID=41978 RepID=UPI0025DABB0E|nr:hypothetical protein [Ruminococcus sp.]MCR5541097.1 hypothetical protein [Ruminococcus sp.]